MNTDGAVEERIDELATRAHEAGDRFEAPESPPDEDRASEIARKHVGPTVSAFVEIRTGDRSVYLSPERYGRLEAAMNEWLRQYVACYGVEMEPECQLRTAAQLLVDTHNALDVARVLTGVPDRHETDG